jgi:pimeloyl-ACP methyl ester carboxylesterase
VTSGFKKDNGVHLKISKFLFSQDIKQNLKDEAISVWEQLDSKFGRGHAIAFKQLFAAIKFRNPKILKNIDIPSLVICGGKDKFVPPSHSKRLDKYLPNSKLYTIAKGGHELHMDSRVKLKRAIIDHVKSNLS